MRVGHTTSNQVQENNAANGAKGAARAGAAKKTDRAAAADGAAPAVAAESTDAKTEISSRARDSGKARDVAMAAPDVREEKIAELKARIAAGKYDVDPKKVADRMVDDHLEMSGLG